MQLQQFTSNLVIKLKEKGIKPLEFSAKLKDKDEEAMKLLESCYPEGVGFVPPEEMNAFLMVVDTILITADAAQSLGVKYGLL